MVGEGGGGEKEVLGRINTSLFVHSSLSSLAFFLCFRLCRFVVDLLWRSVCMCVCFTALLMVH